MGIFFIKRRNLLPHLSLIPPSFPPSISDGFWRSGGGQKRRGAAIFKVNRGRDFCFGREMDGWRGREGRGGINGDGAASTFPTFEEVESKQMTWRKALEEEANGKDSYLNVLRWAKVDAAFLGFVVGRLGIADARLCVQPASAAPIVFPSRVFCNP